MIYQNPFDVMDPNAPANAAASSAMGAITGAVGQMPDPMAMSGDDTQGRIDDMYELLKAPKFEDKFKEYQTQFENIIPPRPKSSIFDMASSVGASMLQNPTQGPYVGLGRGLASFNEEEEKRKQQRINEDRAIAMKAATLAQTDVKSAENMLKEYRILQAKQDVNAVLTEYQVTGAPISVNGFVYQPGEPVMLTAREALAARNNIGKVGNRGVKTSETNLFATFQSKENAEEIIIGLGLPRGSANFDRAVAQITAKNDKMVGKPVRVGQSYAELSLLVRDDEPFNVVLQPSADAGTPLSVTLAEQKLKALGKANVEFKGQLTTALPAAQEAMQRLLKDPTLTTGGLTPIILPMAQVFKQISGSGVDSDYLSGLERLSSISFYLAPKMRPVGSGATSDMEFKAYQQAILSLGNTREANYIALYAYNRMVRNNIALNDYEAELLVDGNYSSMSDLNEKISAFDVSIFEKPPSTVNLKNDAEVKAWLDSLPDGAVIDNTDGFLSSKGVFAIKGFVK